MEKVWKSGKAVSFILSLIAFVYVGYIISQKGRYQPNPNPGPGGAFMVIDTQTGRISAYDFQDTFYTYDSENQTIKKKINKWFNIDDFSKARELGYEDTYDPIKNLCN